jgi:hypothetical protein
MSPFSPKTRKTRDIGMHFGRRLAVGSEPAAPVVEETPIAQETCVACCGTGRIRLRGDRLHCKACKGTGRINVTTEDAAASAGA